MQHKFSRRQVLAAGLASGALAPHFSAHASGSFVINDRVVSDPTSTLPDPDFDNLNYRLAWGDVANTGNLWVAGIDPVTGNLLPTTGQGQLAGIEELRAYNGPTWGFQQGAIGVNSSIFFTKNYPASQGGYGISTSMLVGSTWVESPILNTNGFAGPYASRDLNDPTSIRLFYKGSGDRAYWRYEDNPINTRLPVGTDRARWVPGQHALIMNIKTTARIQQIYHYDVDTALLTQLTFDSGTKNYAYMFQAPEFDNAYIFFCTVANPNGSDDAINLYKFDTNTAQWVKFNQFVIPTNYPYILSPEPFVYKGKSYISLVASPVSQVQNRRYPSVVWIAGIDPNAPSFRQVSKGKDTSQRQGINRNNPKAFFLADGKPYIYYQEVTSTTNSYGVVGGTRVVHLCTTGL